MLIQIWWILSLVKTMKSIPACRVVSSSVWIGVSFTCIEWYVPLSRRNGNGTWKESINDMQNIFFFCFLLTSTKIAFETIHSCRQGSFATAKHCKSCTAYSSLSLIYYHFSIVHHARPQSSSASVSLRCFTLQYFLLFLFSVFSIPFPLSMSWMILIFSFIPFWLAMYLSSLIFPSIRRLWFD